MCLVCVCDAFIPKIFYFCSSLHYSITTKYGDCCQGGVFMFQRVWYTLCDWDAVSFFWDGIKVALGFRIEKSKYNLRLRFEKKVRNKSLVEMKGKRRTKERLRMILVEMDSKKCSTDCFSMLCYFFHSPSTNYWAIGFLREKMPFHGNTPTFRAHENSWTKKIDLWAVNLFFGKIAKICFSLLNEVEALFHLDW